MPVTVQAGLPAIQDLASEGVRVSHRSEAHTAPLRIAILNLMPVKQTTETDLYRLLASTPLPIETTLLQPATHTSKTTSAAHLDRFYKRVAGIAPGQYDGMIITGAPLEKIGFEEVDYWPELTAVMDAAKANVRSTLYVCWAAFAGLYHRYGITKRLFTSKLSGVYPHSITTPRPIVSGFDDEFYVPHSRFAGFDRAEIAADRRLEIIAESTEAGVYLIGETDGNDFFITGHSEYSPLTLDSEYRRDLAKGLAPHVPCNYYPGDDPAAPPVVKWRAHSRLLFTNWLHHYAAPAPLPGLTVG